MIELVRVPRHAMVVFALIGAPGLASAQDGVLGVLEQSQSLTDLRAEQARLFERLISEPDNLDLMFDYAKLSIRLEDYEGAISTLERMLIYRQDLFRVRLELGVAYFRLGSYAASELYFDQVLADPNTPESVKQNIQPYKDAIAGRTQRSRFSVLANVGITHATNATQGPDSNVVLLAGNNAQLVSGTSEADTGMRVILNVSHIYDLQQADDDFWRTDFNFFGVKYFSTEEGDISLVRVRTGPRLSLDAQQFGPKIRPYVEGQYITSESRGLFASYGIGAEVTDTLSPEMSLYTDVGLRYRNYFRSEFTDEDNYSFYGLAGLAYLPERDLIMRGTALFELDSASDPRFTSTTGGRENSNAEFGLRLSAEYQYETGIEWVDRKWSTSAYLEGRARFFEEADPIVDPTKRRFDFDLRSGIRQVFALQDGFGLQLDVDALRRDSNIVNFDVNNVSTTLSLQYRM